MFFFFLFSSSIALDGPLSLSRTRHFCSLDLAFSVRDRLLFIKASGAPRASRSREQKNPEEAMSTAEDVDAAGGAGGGDAPPPPSLPPPPPADLHALARSGDARAIARLLASGSASVDPNARDALARTPLALAAWGGHPRAVAALLVGGASAHLAAKDDVAPLHFAAQRGQAECARLLIEEGNAGVNCRTRKGMTALHFACKRGDAATARVLLAARGVDASIRDAGGKTAEDLLPPPAAADAGESGSSSSGRDEIAAMIAAHVERKGLKAAERERKREEKQRARKRSAQEGEGEEGGEKQEGGGSDQQPRAKAAKVSLAHLGDEGEDGEEEDEEEEDGE